MLDYQIKLHALDPTLADVRIEFAQVPSGVEVRGRLVGPRCPGMSTIEIAYALRAVGVPPVGAPPTLIYQILIPEPTFWKPETPFVYEGRLEFWQGGTMLARKALSLGLRADSRLIC